MTSHHSIFVSRAIVLRTGLIIVRIRIQKVGSEHGFFRFIGSSKDEPRTQHGDGLELPMLDRLPESIISSYI
jgi:hypothetical protein